VSHANKTRLVDYGFEPAFDRKEAATEKSAEDQKNQAKPNPNMVKKKKADPANQAANRKPATRPANTVKPAAPPREN
jgi:hypothetical protein